MRKFFQSNITKAGRIIRALIGLVMLVAAVLAYRIHWVACVGLTVGGVFCLFEAKRGWCIARACGIKTHW